VHPELQVVKADLFRALAHPIRIRLLELLAEGERSVHDLGSALGIGQPVVSQQLAVLRRQQLVAVRKDGTASYYTLRHKLVATLLRVARDLLNHRFAESRTLFRELERERRR
jgi:DNA-binding transcriptional ArsR family regulator